MNFIENTDWSVTKLTREEVDVIMMESLSFEVLNNLIIKDISDVRDYIREKIVTMPVTKSVTKIIELTEYLAIEKTREEILGFLGIGNQTKNFNANIKPLLDYDIIELSVPDKPKSRNQKYRLTSKGKKLLKS